jgi:crotonobetaine/carnitine-CoA ligase
MARDVVLKNPAIPVAERRARIEGEPLPANIGALLDEAAAEAGAHMAWNFFEIGETVSYAGLRRRVNGLARALLAKGVRKGTHVAVMLPNIPALPLTWLALARLGAVMVPVNPSYSPREVAFVVNDSDSEYLIAHRDAMPVVEATLGDGSIKLAAERIFIAGGKGREAFSSWESLATDELEEFTPPEPVGHDDLMNIQYTSGTTGFPKGCMLTQRYWLTSGKVNAFRDARRYERILASTPFFYMDPQWLLLMTFYQRATLFVAARQSGSRFLEWARTHRINFCLFPLILYKNPESPLDKENELVRVNVYGIPRDIHAKLEERFDLVAREAYGMTEVGSAFFMPIEAEDMVGSGSCGQPSPFRECRVADTQGSSLPVGEVGELLIRGPGIMLGYYKNPEATAKAFHGDWFRTGDLFRQDEAGYFYIQGRIKDMIRRAGENIAAREVEAVLTGMADILEAAVVPVRDEQRGEEVKAYLVPQAGAEAKPDLIDRVIAHCSHNLAPFKVPRYLEIIAALPKTSSGKIAKQTLIEQKPDLRSGSYDRVAGKWL